MRFSMFRNGKEEQIDLTPFWPNEEDDLPLWQSIFWIGVCIVAIPALFVANIWCRVKKRISA